MIRVVNLRFTALNDFPSIVVNPTTLDTTEDVAGGLNIRAIQVNDPDVSETPGGELLVTLRVSHGTLTVRDNLGTLYVKPGDISGNGTGTVILAASPAEINNTLAAIGGLIYQPNPQYFGQDILRIDANDQGLTGFGGQGLAQGSLTINVASVNDPPQLTVPSAKSMQEDGTLLLPGISVTDEDAGTAVIQVTVSADEGDAAGLDKRSRRHYDGAGQRHQHGDAGGHAGRDQCHVGGSQRPAVHAQRERERRGRSGRGRQ